MASQITVPPTTVDTATSEHNEEPGYHISFGRILAYTFLILGALIAVVPFLYTVSVSLMNLTEATGGAFLPSSPQWSNYSRAWNDANFSLYLWNSIRITLITVTGLLV